MITEIFLENSHNINFIKIEVNTTKKSAKVSINKVRKEESIWDLITKNIKKLAKVFLFG